MFTHLIFFLLLSIAIAVSYAAAEDDQFRNCSGEPYSCGQVQNLTYPFWGDNRPQFCGHKDFNLTCYDNEYPIIHFDGVPFRIHEVSQTTHTMNLSRFMFDFRSNFCSVPEPRAGFFNPGLFQYGSDTKQLFIYYDCGGSDEIPIEFPKFGCDVQGRKKIGFYSNDSNSGSVDAVRLQCRSFIHVPISRSGLDGLFTGSENIQEVLDDGFSVEYNNAYTANCSRCEGSQGVCGSDTSGLELVCLCREARDQTDQRICATRATHHPDNKINWRVKLGIGLGTAGFTALVMALGFFIYHRRNRRRYSPASWVSRSMSSYPSSVRDLEKTGGAHFGVQIFCYKELEKATNYFDSERELGDGGYGTVYQGKLKDGRDIAVKRLYEHNYNRVEQFMNEVEILSRLRHQNLVSLYGFTSRHSRELLLVYEYISNGTVADHLHGERASSQPLTLTTRMSIAVETASALVYLHASDIIHRDVKTNNILLDDNNKVKVADFGLSRLLPNDVTHVSTAPQGTPGYVDPDYHESYQLTDKSDVYSFGVVLVELISSKPAVDMSRHRHEINLSNMAINKIQNNEVDKLVDPSLGYESDDKVRNMILCVAELAFRCLQSGKDMRPSMVEVLENLKIIQSDDSDVKNGDEMGDLRKEIGVIPMLSPDSVTTPWISKGTTPNTSS